MLKELLYFIKERERIRTRKAAGQPAPWSADPILSRYRFCNVNREHDKVTEWIHKNIRKRFAKDPDLWFALVVARLINQPSTLSGIYFSPRHPVKAAWNRKAFMEATEPSDERNPRPIWNAAYIVSTNGVTMEKRKYIADRVLGPLWEQRDAAYAGIGTDADCQSWADWLMSFNGISDFLANQIVTDYKYTDICAFAPDRTTFVLAGPGTKRGLNRYHGRPTDAPLRQEQAQEELKKIRSDLARAGWREYMQDLNNLSNCFCEFDKYLRAKVDGGRPKQLYRPEQV